MDRRKFVTHAGLAGAAGLLTACGGSAGTGTAECKDGTAAAKAIEWKMVTAWPRDFPGLGTGANRLAEYITRLSNGRLSIKVYGSNELVPAFEVVDALHELPADFRQVVVLADLEGMSYRDIADRVGCPMGTVMSRLARARTKLAQAFTRRFGTALSEEMP